MAFVFRAVDEVGATLNTALVVMGDKLGYYRALADGRPARRPAELAERTGTGEHYARGVAERPGRRRLSSTYDPATGRYTLPGRARRRARPTRPARRTCPGFFQIALGTVRDAARGHRGGPRR